MLRSTTVVVSTDVLLVGTVFGKPTPVYYDASSPDFELGWHICRTFQEGYHKEVC